MDFMVFVVITSQVTGCRCVRPIHVTSSVASDDGEAVQVAFELARSQGLLVNHNQRPRVRHFSGF